MPTNSGTTVKLDAETKQRIRRLESERQRCRLRHDAVAALESYGATGLHVTAEKADVWLAKLEAGEDREPPACHTDLTPGETL
jgi:predicted transcriptional regulator